MSRVWFSLKALSVLCAQRSTVLNMYFNKSVSHIYTSCEWLTVIYLDEYYCLGIKKGTLEYAATGKITYLNKANLLSLKRSKLRAKDKWLTSKNM